MAAHREGVWTERDDGAAVPSTDWRVFALQGGVIAGLGTVATLVAARFGLALPAGVVVGGCGLRTSFALFPSQAVGAVRHDLGLSGLRHRLNLALARETPVGPLSVSFWPLGQSLQRRENDAADLRYALNAALEGRRTEHPFAQGQWPPLALGPGAPTVRALLLRALAPVFAWTLVAATLASCLLAPAPWLALGTFVVLAGGVNAAIARENALRWRAYRDRLRLRRHR